MARSLAGKVVIVTGAAQGIGAAYAEHLAEHGASVILADRQAPGPRAEGVLASHPRTSYAKMDVRVEGDPDRLAHETFERHGRIDVLVNNAAIFTSLQRRPLEEVTTDEWREVLEVNVIGLFACVRAVVPHMKRQERGKIINIGSNVAHKGLPELHPYVASKGAVHAMTRALANELGEFGITVNAVAPGYVMHEGTAAIDRGRNERVKTLRALARTQTPEDLVGAVAFLASDQSDFMTGQTLVVDGGEVFS